MTTFYSWFGLAVWYLIALGILGIAIAMAIEAVKGLYDRLSYHHRELGKRDAGGELLRLSHWFSEIPEAAEALRAAGQELATTGWIRGSETREAWREKLAKLTHKGRSMNRARLAAAFDSMGMPSHGNSQLIAKLANALGLPEGE